MNVFKTTLNNRQDKENMIFKIKQMQDETILPLANVEYERIYSQKRVLMYEYTQDNETASEFLKTVFRHLDEAEKGGFHPNILLQICLTKDCNTTLKDLDPLSKFGTEWESYHSQCTFIYSGITKSHTEKKCHLFAFLLK